MEDSKTAFFDAVIAFKESIIADLKKFRIIDLKEIEKLEVSLGEIERCRGKGGDYNKVYHYTWIHFGNAQKQIVELISLTSKIKVAFKPSKSPFTSFLPVFPGAGLCPCSFWPLNKKAINLTMRANPVAYSSCCISSM